MARPAFLSSLGSPERRTPTGLKSPTQMDRDRANRQLPDSSRPAFLSDLGGGVPTGLKPPSQMDQSSFQNFNIDDGSSNNIAGGTTNLLTGSAGNKFANPGGMPGNTQAQQILGSNYNRFLALGYTPNEIDAQLERAMRFGRGIDVDKIEDQLNKFEQFNASGFNESGVAPMIGDQQFLSVSKPEIYANPSEGLGGLLGDMFGPFVDMAGDVMQGIGEGKVGALGLLNQAKNKFDESVDKGKSFLDNLNQPGTLGFRVRALTPEQRTIYNNLTMNQGISPFEAIKQAEKKAMGGIATLQ